MILGGEVLFHYAVSAAFKMYWILWKKVIALVKIIGYVEGIAQLINISYFVPHNFIFHTILYFQICIGWLFRAACFSWLDGPYLITVDEEKGCAVMHRILIPFASHWNVSYSLVRTSHRSLLPFLKCMLTGKYKNL